MVFDITECEVEITLFESNGAQWANYCVHCADGDVSYECRIYDEEENYIE